MKNKLTYGSNVLPIAKTDKIKFIKDKCRNRNVLDLGCIRHNADFSVNDPNWLHRHLREVADSIVGVDYLKDEVQKLNESGYKIVHADVIKPLPVEKSFDVIVAGDLIEHLTCFEGFFNNITRLMKDDGILILTTPNPFYRDGFFYTFFKNNVLVNPEHTCWIDPKCLKQITERFSLEITELYWLTSSQWLLSSLITESSANEYDILKGQWKNKTKIANVKRRLIGYLFGLFYFPIKILMSKNSVNYADYLAVIRKKKSKHN